MTRLRLREFRGLAPKSVLGRQQQNSVASLIAKDESFEKPREDNPNKKLKIGYIAQNLKRHPVGFLSRWTINYHNREQFASTP